MDWLKLGLLYWLFPDPYQRNVEKWRKANGY